MRRSNPAWLDGASRAGHPRCEKQSGYWWVGLLFLHCERQAIGLCLDGHLSARFGGHDFSSLPPDHRLTRDDFADLTLLEASRSRVIGYVQTTLRDGLTLRQLLKRLAGARGHLAIAGTLEQVAAVAA